MKTSNRRSIIIVAICATCTLLLAIFYRQGFLPLQEAEFFAQDWQARLGRKTPVDERLALIGISKANYESYYSDEELAREPVLGDLQSDFPWSRAVWARLIEKLADAGAKVIILDLVFASPGKGDDEFYQVLEKYKDRVVIGYLINVNETERGKFRELMLPNATVLPPDATNPQVEDTRLGYVNVWPDFDRTLRRVNFHLTSAQVGDIVPDGVVLESLGARALRKFGRADAIPTDFNSRIFRYTAPGGIAFKPYPVGDVLSPKLWERNYASGKDFEGKIVLIGPTAAIFQDEHNTPFNNPKPMVGPEIHLQLINAALHGEFVRELSLAGNLWIIVIFGAIAGVLCLLIRQPGRLFVSVIGLSGVYLIFAQLLFDHAGWVIPLALPLMLLVSSSLITMGYSFALERLEKLKLRTTMGLYFSPRVLEVVLANPGSMEPRRADVTLLLTDLRNSTPLSEALSPQEMFEMLNHVFEVQTQAIMGEEGSMEHFLGDQFLSYWGAPQAQPDAADRASRAAIKLIAAMEKLRPTLSPQIQKLFGYGVALHSGEVLVGNKGSAQRLDYGLVGDTVNEAARIEALTKYYGARLLVSSVTFGQLTTQVTHRLVDHVIVKGKTEPVVLFEFENPCTPPQYPEICRRYEAAYADYTAGHFAKAQEQFDGLVREFSDGPSNALSARCADLLANPPAAWKGVWKMDTK